MKLTFTEAGWADYLWFQQNDKKLLKKILIVHCYMKSEKECYRYNKSSRAFTDRATLIC